MGEGPQQFLALWHIMFPRRRNDINIAKIFGYPRGSHPMSDLPLPNKHIFVVVNVISLHDQRVSWRGEESARESLFSVVTCGRAMSILIHL